jgi:hypothetical protein
VALAPLATVADLAARNIDTPSGMNADAILASASAAVRDAAGCPILAATSTVILPAPRGPILDLPAGPVSVVTVVVLNGTLLVAGTDYTKIGDSLWRPVSWAPYHRPVEVSVTYSHGYAQVPEDIIDLVCALTGMAFDQAGEYGKLHRLQSVRLGNFSESYTHPTGEQPSPAAIPDSTRQRLRERFGAAVAAIGMG